MEPQFARGSCAHSGQLPGAALPYASIYSGQDRLRHDSAWRFSQSESLAYGGDGLPKQFLYLVCFEQTHVWGAYPVSPDKLYIDIYEP